MRSESLSSDSALRPLQYVLLIAMMTVGFGYDLGMIFANQQYLSDFFILSGNESDVIIGTSLLGVVLGLFLGGWLNYGSGRRLCLLCGASLGTLSITASFFAPNLSILLCSQFVIGFSWGLFLLSAVLYTPEITLPGNRGFACCLNGVFFSFGVVLAVLTRELNPLHGTPLLVVSMSACSAAVIVVAAVRLPESPRYLASVGQSDGALNVLFKLRRSMGLAARELAGINECYREEVRGARLFLQSPAFRRAFWMVLCLLLLLQASGMSIIPFSLSALFSENEAFDVYHSYDFTYGVLKAACAVFLFGAVTAALMVDRLGRRALLFVSALLVNLALFILCISFVVGKFFFAPLLITIGVLLFIYAAAVAFITVVFLLLPELSPGRGREFAAAGVLLCLTVGTLFSLQIYPRLAIFVGFNLMFLFFLLSSLCLTAVCFFFVPNTANASLEGMENRLLEGVPLRALGRMREKREEV